MKSKSLLILTLFALTGLFTSSFKAKTEKTLYAIGVAKHKSTKTVYISYIAEYKEDSWRTDYDYSENFKKALKIEVGSSYSDYNIEVYRKKPYALFYLTKDEARVLRNDLLSEYRGNDYKVLNIDWTILFEK